MPTRVPDAAIGSLESLLNSADRYNAVDSLANVQEATRRLHTVGLLPADGALDASELEVVREVRECLRQLAASNTEQRSPTSESVERFTDLLTAGRLHVRIEVADSLEVALDPSERRDALATVLGNVAAAVYDTVQAGVWARMKTCANVDCQWGFYDRSRSRTGRWCDMRACGNLLKARAYRQRQRGSPSSA